MNFLRTLRALLTLDLIDESDPSDDTDMFDYNATNRYESQMFELRLFGTMSGDNATF